MKLKSPLKYFGGKHYLAERIVNLFPPASSYLTYVEPYFGSGAVLFRHNPIGKSEVINDISSSLMAFWKCLQDPVLFAEFSRRVAMQPFCQQSWEDSCRILDSLANADESNYQETSNESNTEFNTNEAFTEFSFSNTFANISDKDSLSTLIEGISLFICCRMSLGGRFKDFAAITKNRLRGGMNEQVSAWLSCVESLPEIHSRLSRVLILNENAINVIHRMDSPTTLYYIDCPYLLDTRTNKKGGEYISEMSVEDHTSLLETLANIKGRFVLSCYPNKLYTSWFEDHSNCHYYDLHTVAHSAFSAASSTTKANRVERVYLNY